MRKALFIAGLFFLGMTIAAAEISLGSYLKQKKIKSFTAENVDVKTGMEMIVQQLNEGNRPRQVTFELSPKVEKLAERINLKLEDVSAEQLLRSFFQALLMNAKPPLNKAKFKVLIVDDSRLAIAFVGEPFPGVRQTTRTIRGHFLRNKKPQYSVKQLKEGIVVHGINFPDVKMSFQRKRLGKNTSVGILKITGSEPEVKRAVAIFTLFYGSSFNNYHTVSAPGYARYLECWIL